MLVHMVQALFPDRRFFLHFFFFCPVFWGMCAGNNSASHRGVLALPWPRGNMAILHPVLALSLSVYIYFFAFCLVSVKWRNFMHTHTTAAVVFLHYFVGFPFLLVTFPTKSESFLCNRSIFFSLPWCATSFQLICETLPFFHLKLPSDFKSAHNRALVLSAAYWAYSHVKGNVHWYRSLNCVWQYSTANQLFGREYFCLHASGVGRDQPRRATTSLPLRYRVWWGSDKALHWNTGEIHF